MNYYRVVCAGTFDRLHAGHMSFLDGVFATGQHVGIGLTSDQYIQRYKPKENVLPFQQRQKDLEKFLEERGYSQRADVFPIDDRYGKSIDPMQNYQAIVTSPATKKGAHYVNEKREKLGLTLLPIVIVPYLFATNGSILSSTLIRSGTLGRKGEFFPNPLWTHHTLFLSSNVREILHQPFGQLLSEDIPAVYLKDPEKIITVGDITTKRFHTLGIFPKISVIDFLVERKPINTSLVEEGFNGEEKSIHVTNPAGQLTPQVWEKIQEITKQLHTSQKFIVQVQGEEDLLVIPLILLLPLGYKLFYGQPKEGVVYIDITEQIKMEVFTFLKQFTASTTPGS